MYDIHMYTVQCTLYSVHCTMHIVQCIMYSIRVHMCVCVCVCDAVSDDDYANQVTVNESVINESPGTTSDRQPHISLTTRVRQPSRSR